MSVNTSHANNGVLIHAGEYILLHSDGVTLDFSGQDNPLFKGSKQGRIYLTSHRMIFNNKKPADPMQSFSAPFVAMSDLELEQPVFGANYIKGKVRAQPNGNYVGEVKFKLHFKAGGAIEYGQALRRAAHTAQSNMRQTGQYSDDPPPYTPSGAWHEAPPPAYQPPPGYYGWLPTHDAFSGPAPNSVFMSDNPPPYPGIGGHYHIASPVAQPYGAQQPPQPAASYQPPPQQYNNNTPSWNGFSVPSQQQPGGQQPPPQGGGWAAPGSVPTDATGGGYPQPPPYGYGAPGYAAPQPGAGYGYQPQQYNNTAPPSWNGFSLPPDQPSHGQPQNPAAGSGGGFAYPPGAAAGGAASGAMGFSAPPPNSKEAEAMASAFNTPYNQGGPNASVNDMPPSYNDLPPSYGDPARKPQ